MAAAATNCVVPVLGVTLQLMRLTEAVFMDGDDDDLIIAGLLLGTVAATSFRVLYHLTVLSLLKLLTAFRQLSKRFSNIRVPRNESSIPSRGTQKCFAFFYRLSSSRFNCFCLWESVECLLC